MASVGADAKLSRLVGFADDPLSQVDGIEIRMLVRPMAIQMAQSKVGRAIQFCVDSNTQGLHARQRTGA